jgi:hypothetical protein
MKEGQNKEKGIIMKEQDFITRLKKYPSLEIRFQELLDIVENSAGDLDKADDAEERVTQELQKMGNALLGNWARNQEEKKYQETVSKKPDLRLHSKKKYTGKRNTDL